MVTADLLTVSFWLYVVVLTLTENQWKVSGHRRPVVTCLLVISENSEGNCPEDFSAHSGSIFLAGAGQACQAPGAGPGSLSGHPCFILSWL